MSYYYLLGGPDGDSFRAIALTRTAALVNGATYGVSALRASIGYRGGAL